MNEFSTEQQSTGISRRSMLKKGAQVTGAAVWTVPVIQMVSMTAAHADTPSAPSQTPPQENPPPTDSTPTKASSAVDAISGKKGVAPVAKAAPAAPNNSGALAFTGASIAPPIIGAAAALAIGTGLIIAGSGSSAERELPELPTSE
jgi:hypothetical protein